MERESDKRKSGEVMADIERTLSTVDGISTADAFKLGQLVREYGDKKSGEALGPLIEGLFDNFGKAPKKPWEGV